jgi:hypothetical protein
LLAELILPACNVHAGGKLVGQRTRTVLILEAAMRAGTLVAFAVLFALLAAAGWYAFAGLPAAGEEVPSDYYIALIAGALSAVLVGVALMTLVFYSSRRGYDEPPKLQRDVQREQ